MSFDRAAFARERDLLKRALRRWKGYRLPGGLPARHRLRPARFDSDQLAIGTKVELEHTRDPALAMEIAMAHLHEDRRYYEKLERMERGRAFGRTQVGVEPVDRYTAAHGALGFVLGVWGAPWWVALGSTLLFELCEDALKRAAPSLFPVAAPDTWANSILDSAAWMAGWGVGRALPDPKPARMWRKS
jgi:hypothetical protein